MSLHVIFLKVQVWTKFNRLMRVTFACTVGLIPNMLKVKLDIICMVSSCLECGTLGACVNWSFHNCSCVICEPFQLHWCNGSVGIHNRFVDKCVHKNYHRIAQCVNLFLEWVSGTYSCTLVLELQVVSWSGEIFNEQFNWWHVVWQICSHCLLCSQ